METKIRNIFVFKKLDCITIRYMDDTEQVIQLKKGQVMKQLESIGNLLIF